MGKHASSLAAVDEHISLNYQQLGCAARNVSKTLINDDVFDECVGISGPPSVRTLAALLGVVLSGNHYLYVDVSQPADWLGDHLRHVGCRRVLHCGDTLPDIVLAGVAFLPVTLDTRESAVALPELSAQHAAYINFSSGSTGQPKAIVCTHAGVTRLCQQQDFLPFGAALTFLFHSPLSFDAATLEIWGALLNGGCCVVNAGGMLTPEKLRAHIRQRGVNTLWLTASLFNTFVDVDLACLSGIQHLLTGGDALSTSHVRRALAAHKATRFINGYGPTENTTFTCCHVIRPQDAAAQDIPIGRAINGTEVGLYDAAGAPVTCAGETGEIYAFGAGLARGYHRSPDRNARAFVTVELRGRRMRAYRTGDLARYDDDGYLHFVGRVDSQVKINGYRLNLAALEAYFRQVNAIQDCALLVVEQQGSKRLVAVLLAQDDGPARDAALALASWERPGAYLCLRRFPLTPHGKTDRRALLAEWQAHQRRHTEVEEPLTPMQTLCAAWWAQILGQPVVDPELDFFQAGGNSLLALRLLAITQADGGEADISLNELYDHSTLAAFARLLSAKGRSATSRHIAIPEQPLVL